MIEEMNKVKALFPDNVEKIIISKDDYDRLTGELTLENIELKQEIERLNNIVNEVINYTTKQMKKYEGYDKVFETILSNIIVILGSDKE